MGYMLPGWRLGLGKTRQIEQMNPRQFSILIMCLGIILGALALDL